MNPDIDETEESGSHPWGLLTGWRMIAQDVMHELETSVTDTTHPSVQPLPDHGCDEVEIPADVVRAVQSNRLKSVIAKSGENFYTDYQMNEEIGTGAFGRAIKATRRTDQEIVVVKELIGRRMTQKEISEAKNEVKVLAHLNHPNIVRYYDFYSDSGKMHIVMEFCEEGDLSTYLKSRNGVLLEENEIMMKFVQICLALHHTHSQGILHRDLKSQNIFLTTHGILKLGDFGISRIMDGEQAMARSMVGTPYYLSPEICEDKPYGPKSDVWSLGCVLYELCMLKHAFDGQSLPALVLKILSGTVPEIPSKYSPNLDSLVKRLLTKDPESRPSIAEMLNFDYVRKHLQHYAAHIHFSVVRRRDSFQKALEPFNLRAPTEGTGLKLKTGRTSSHSFAEGHQRRSDVSFERPDLDEWGEIENENDQDSFEISPYRFYTKDEDHDGGGLLLRTTQTETCFIPETPLAAEFSSNLVKLRAFKARVFGMPNRMKSTLYCLDEHPDQGAEDETPVQGYTSDEDALQERVSEADSEGSADASIEEQGPPAEHVTQVVTQIRDIMKSPSTRIELPDASRETLLPSITISKADNDDL